MNILNVLCFLHLRLRIQWLRHLGNALLPVLLRCIISSSQVVAVFIVDRAGRPPKHNKFIRKELDSLLDAGIIVPASAPWSFPVVIFSEKDRNLGSRVDYRSVNRVTKADRCPLPRIEEDFDDVCGSKLFVTSDVFSGYWQVRMADSCKEITNFTTCYVPYQFEAMSFGLMTATCVFSAHDEHRYPKPPFVRVYLDDVVKFSESVEEQVIHI